MNIMRRQMEDKKNQMKFLGVKNTILKKLACEINGRLGTKGEGSVNLKP